MKKILFLILACATGAHAQETVPGPFYIGATFSVNTCYRTLKNNDGQTFTDAMIERSNELEMPKLGYNIGVGVLYKFSHHFELESGIEYSNRGYQTVPQEFHDITPNGQIVSTGMSGNVVYNFRYIDVPVKANYVFGAKKVRFTAGAGITANVFLGEVVTSVTRFDDGRVDKDRNASSFEYSPFNLSPIVSAGVDYSITEKMTCESAARIFVPVIYDH